MANFPIDPAPSYPIEEAWAEPQVLISKHRDGTEQRRLKGAGTLSSYKLVFGASLPITNTQRLAILSHYAGQNGTLASFIWVHPERAGEVHLVRYAEKPTFQHVGYDCYEGSVTLQEVSA
jgi:phage-related protein